MSRLHEEAPSGAWHPVPELAGLGTGEVVTTHVGDTSVLACRIGSDVFAFVDRCARCESSLAGAVLARRLGGATGDALLRCPSCQVHYDVRKAGSCVDLPELHLDPLPLLSEGDTISVAVLTAEVA